MAIEKGQQGSFPTRKLVHKASGSSVEVSDFGATVLRWVSGGKERLYLSPKAIFDGSKAVRGGIPLGSPFSQCSFDDVVSLNEESVFPWFGKPAGRATQHGFARNLVWHFDEAQHAAAKEDNVSASWTLSPNETTKSVWAHDFLLTYTITLTADALVAKLAVKNVDQQGQFTFSTLLHTYFGVQNIADVQVHGLQGIRYEDKTMTTDDLQQNDAPTVSFTGEVDRTFKDAPNTVKVEEKGKTILTLEKTNLKDTVVWNPWADKAKAMADMPDEDYHKFLCVEVGTVIEDVVLPAGQSWEATHTIKAL